MKIRYLALACSVFVAGMANPAAVCQTQVPVETDAIFQTDLMPLGFAPQLAGFTRTEVVSYDKEQFNVAANFNDAETSTFVSLYVYRAGIKDPRIWGDRAATVMLSSNSLGQPDLDQVSLGTFTPPNGAGQDSGFRLAVPLTGSEWVSSGLSLFMHDGWLIKIRMSSRTLERDRLLQRMGEFTDALRMEPAHERLAAYRTMEGCTNPLEFRREAKMIRLDAMGSLLFGTVFKMASEETERGKGKTPVMSACREKLTDAYAVYRMDEADDSYIVAFGDSGTTASVDEYHLSALIKPSKGYTVDLSDGVTSQIFPPFDHMPTPAQVYTVVNQVKPQVTIDIRPGGDRGVTISVPAPADTETD